MSNLKTFLIRLLSFDLSKRETVTVQAYDAFQAQRIAEQEFKGWDLVEVLGEKL